ncbi:glycosyltransferase family 4 protein [Flavobacterium subsaxonicum]|uniref:glycosyltransferase family 4 protein n=1 Tax=Flavobacterium subsaxonicum TaxID=426226 RepID=UPI00040EF19B|nr:glycosyltransferase family 1 protein [Flavobacterium subsaxonicum]
MSNTNKITRIFVDCHVFDGTFQGTTTYIKGIYQELVKHKNLHIYFAAENITALQQIFGQADNIHYLKFASHNKFYRLLFDIPKLIRDNKIEYAHFQYVVPPIKYCKYINTLHDVLFMEYPQYFPLSYRIKNKLLFKLSAKMSDVVLTVSHYSKEQIEKHFKLNNVTITPNAVDPVFFEPFDKQAVQQEVKAIFGVENYWLFVSRWEPRKNHHGLLKAFAEGGFYKDQYLVFVGDKALPNPEFDTIYNALPPEVKQKVVMLSQINFDKLLLLVRGAALSVYPSVAEGFGIPPLEAAGAGVPVACSKTTAMSDFAFFDPTLFDPFDTQDMVKKIQLAPQTSVDQIKIKIKEQYNWEVSAQNFIAALA